MLPFRGSWIQELMLGDFGSESVMRLYSRCQPGLWSSEGSTVADSSSSKVALCCGWQVNAVVGMRHKEKWSCPVTVLVSSRVRILSDTKVTIKPRERCISSGTHRKRSLWNLMVKRSYWSQGFGKCVSSDIHKAEGEEDIFVLKRCQGTTPAPICPKSRTAGKPLRIRSSWGEPGSLTSVTPATTSWGATPSPANGTSAGAVILRFVRKVSIVF